MRAMRLARWWILPAIIVAGLAVAWRVWPPRRPDASPPSGSTGAPAVAATTATFVGSDTCRGCHQDAFTAWQSSQHREAMQPATSASVKGRFDGAEFRYDTVVSTFFQRDGRYW